MIYRNFIAPSRDFTQLTNALIRHPRLDSHATRLLTWQLSLPAHARETLSDTAKRARIGATSFITAKRQLKAEGYVHERRVQMTGGLWATQQLVSSTPLRPEEAAKVFARLPAHTGIERVYPQVAPSARPPAVGGPTPPSTDGHPEKTPEGKTSNPPPEPEHEPRPEREPDPESDPESEPEGEPGPDPQFVEARALVGALPPSPPPSAASRPACATSSPSSSPAGSPPGTPPPTSTSTSGSACPAPGRPYAGQAGSCGTS
ncbi:hypothetical protein [Streptomyces gardneri]|uniref:Uncharacterized protein n=1 Tax=Streptomyces gardneri TaxID=66892 RepID=A0A4Y3RX20_9ACTN|nr:hypothetical protein [Streptomyces gardneri]GEB60440.1 hypothetical protein SGA01_60450 [Streptomyces gardneri]GHH10759.1 hypothetical protein GCM10017674_55350 [Streptomyces gardneri]